ncbi:MAG TPA: chemotaxis protein CheX [Verrucomicrobiae bacterium]|nr:chemotaxis protein CheX [Verrucomicrobiae bacterium]
MNAHLVDVFETMLSLKATPVPVAASPHFTSRTTGSVGFAGDKVTGGVYLHLSSDFAQRIAAAMLGLPSGEAPGETEINDVVGECTNMLAGGLKSYLCDKNFECVVSTPAIIRGTSFSIESLPDVRQELLVYDCSDSRFAVEIHIKFS